MVSATLLLQISQRLKELADLTKSPRAGNDFGGFVIVVMGDFMQIPPVRSRSLLQESLHPSSDPTTEDALGGALWTKFFLVVFSQQMRAREAIQCSRVEILRGGTITKELLDGIGFITEDELQSDTWKDPTFLVGTNEERYALNTALGLRFAKLHGVPFIKWKNNVGGTVAVNAPPMLLEAIQDYVQDLTGSFIQGAPTMILNNFSPQCGLANGSIGTMVGLGGLQEEDKAAIAAANPGETVWLSKPPSHVVVYVKALESNANIPRVSVNGKVGIPLKLCPDSGDLPRICTDIKSRSVAFSWHYVALGFAYTFHKCQGQTLNKVVVCLDQPKNHKLTFEQVLVGLTRVRNGNDLKMLHPISLSTTETWKKLCSLKPSPWFNEYFDKKMFPSGKLEGYRTFNALEDTKAKKSKKRLREKRDRGDEDEKLRQLREAATREIGGETEERRLARQHRVEILRAIRTHGSFIHMEAVDTVLFGVAKEYKSDVIPVSGLEWLKFHATNQQIYTFQPGRRYMTFVWYSNHFIPVEVNTTKNFVRFADSLQYNVELRNMELEQLADRVATCISADVELRLQRVEKFQTENECGFFTIAKIIEWMRLPCPMLPITRETLPNLYLKYAPQIQ